MVRSALQVFTRTRPTSEFAHDSIRVDDDNATLHIHLDRKQDSQGPGLHNLTEDWSFRTSKVLHNSSQDAVYTACARDMVAAALDGYNGTLMAYGQTGAGKTFTMTGDTHNYKYRGVAPRALAQLFQSIAARPENLVTVRISYLEIYNESFNDLLGEDGSNSRELVVMENGRGNVEVKGLRKVETLNEEEGLNLLFEGNANRKVGKHLSNANSSRSHTIFTIHIESRSRVKAQEKVVYSKLNLVDLAGSERVKKTDSRGSVLREAQHINRSLTFLEQVVIALSSKGRDHVPFRSSKLTHVLRDSLGGNCVTRLIANIWPEKRQLEETISTLKFATRMMRLTNDATVNIDLDPNLLVKKYEQQIVQLKQELAMHDTLSNRGPVSYDPYTPEQQYELATAIRKYVRGDIDTLEVISLQQVHEMFNQFRNIVLRLEEDAKSDRRGSSMGAGPSASLAPESSSSNATAAEAEAKAGDANANDLVGEVDEGSGGFNVGGNAPANAAPSLPPKVHEEAPSRAPSPIRSPIPVDELRSRTRSPSPNAARGLGIEEDVQFVVFRDSDGKQEHHEYESERELLKSKRRTLREESSAVNEAKRAIDELAQSLKIMRRERELQRVDDGSSEEIIDEEEYDALRKLSEQKSRYDDAFRRRIAVKNDIALSKAKVKQLRTKLAHSFLEWHQHHRDDAGGDVLDDAEQFEMMEHSRIVERDPESLSYYNASKNLRNYLKNKKAKRWTTASKRNQ